MSHADGIQILPAALNGFPREGLVQSGDAHEAVNSGAQTRSFTEFHAEQCRHQVEVEDAGKTPVQCADYD